jgi:hypothetical protein
MGEYDVVIAFDRPQNLKPDKPRHFVHQRRSAGESFLEFFFKTAGDLNSIRYDKHSFL